MISVGQLLMLSSRLGETGGLGAVVAVSVCLYCQGRARPGGDQSVFLREVATLDLLPPTQFAAVSVWCQGRGLVGL